MAIDPAYPLEQTETALAIANVKSVAEQPAMLSNLMFANLVANVNLTQQNAASNQQAANEVGRAVTGKVVNTVLNLGPLEAMSSLQILTGQMVAEELIDIKAAVQGVSGGGGGHRPHPQNRHKLKPGDPGYNLESAIDPNSTVYAQGPGTLVVTDKTGSKTANIAFTAPA